MISISNFCDGDSGTTTLVWCNKLQTWFSGDSEGKIYSKASAQDEHESTVLGSEAIRSIAFHPTKDECAVAEDDVVSVRSSTNLESIIDQGVCKSTLPFTHIDYDHLGRFIFAASMESDVNVIPVEKGAAQKISTSNLGVRTFSLSPDSKYIAVVDIDGAVCVTMLTYAQSVDGTHSICQKDLATYSTGLISKTATRTATESGCKVAWYPDSNNVLLAVPSMKSSVVVLTPNPHDTEERKWSEDFLLATGDVPSHGKNDLSIAEFSPNGRYLVTADLAGTILVWSFDVKKVSSAQPLYKLNSEPLLPLRDVAWGRLATDNYIIAITANDWHQFPEVVRGGKPLPALLEGASSVQKGVSFTQAPTQTGTQLDDLSASDFLHTQEKEQAAEGEHSDEAAMLAAVEAAEAEYLLQSQTENRAQQAQLPHSPVSTTKSGAASVAPAALKRLTKLAKSSSAMDDDDDDLLFGDDNSVAAPAPAAEPASMTVSSNGTVKAAAVANDDDSINIASIKAKHTVPATAKAAKSSTLIDDEAEDDDDDYDDEDADVVIDEGNGNMSLQQMMKIAQASGVLPGSALTPVRTLQPPFQPSSTKFDEKRRRYLVWNTIGSIVLREETLENRVEISFANTAGANRNESFPDRDGFTMGAMSREGAVFASPPEPSEDPVVTDFDPEFRKETPGSTIVYHAFAGQKHLAGANESFRWTLSDGEAALAVGVGCGWVAVASSRNLLYIFSSTGMPCATMALQGPVVCLSGHEAQLGVVYHSHTMQCDLFEITWRNGCRVSKLTTVVLPLPAKVEDKPTATAGLSALVRPVVSKEQGVEWMGYDVDNHLLSLLDAQGVLWCLTQCAGYQWVPVLDTHKARKSIEHTFWPTQIRFGKLVYVLLNGESRPAIYPQPVVASKALRVPVPCLRDGKDVGEVHKERMHAILWNNALATHTEFNVAEANSAVMKGLNVAEDPEVLEKRLETLQFEADKAVLKALQDACQRQRIPLALSLALQLRTERVIETAITVANHFGRAVVAEALDTILENKRALTAALQAQQMQGGEAAYVGGSQYSSSEYASEEQDYDHQAPTFDHESSPPAHHARKVNFTDEAGNAGLSNKLSARSSAMPPPSAKPTVVSPTFGSGTGSAEKEKAPARNPFAVVSSGHTPQKRKNVFDGIQDMKASPSPKKPTLNRQSSFSQQARQQRLSDKRIL